MEFRRLLEKEQKVVSDCRNTVAQWEEFCNDYQALQQRLTTLPDHLKHDVMVPFGKHAFIPGHLYHTNEIMVLLGDNWFAQVTAKQARDIVSRRQKVVETKLADARRQLEDVEAKLAFTSSFQQQDAVEIKEELKGDEQPVSRKRIAHKKKQPAAVKTSEKTRQDDADRELWQRLDELERQEEQRHEQDKDEREVYVAASHTEMRTTKIDVMHTSLPTIDTGSREHPPSGIINSPADICVKQSTVEDTTEQSLVKSKSVHWSSDVVAQPRLPDSPARIPAPVKIKPFTGSVVEKTIDNPTTSTDTVRKVSRFKAARQT